MSTVNLLTPILSGGIQNVNFVDGRVLTAADMTAERTANLQRQRLLGTCIGDGVASGFEVTLSPSSVPYGTQVVHVTAGVAVNLNGDGVQLASDTDVTLAGSGPAAPASSGLFTPCQPPQTQLTNPGIFILTVMPASGYQGQAPMVNLNSNGVATSCTSQYATAGVQFRLVMATLNPSASNLQSSLLALATQIQNQLASGASSASVASALSQFQNGLAYVCFGTDTLASFPANPFPPASQPSPYDSYGLVDTMRSAGLVTDCEVPLALIYWTPAGIQFVDMWSVRRYPTARLLDSGWPLFVGNRHRNEVEAMFLQFQSQLQGIVSTAPNLSSVIAAQYFDYLPPAGIIPIAGSGGSPGFTYPTFFQQQPYHPPIFVLSSRVDSIVRTALPYPPVNLQNNEAIWLYQPVQGTNSAPYLVFTNINVPYQGDARFDVTSWNYGNFS
jgi:hypothetical protein